MKVKGFASEELNGFLDQGTELLGELRFRHTFRIDGHVKGKIVSDNTLVVGETGVIEAEVDCGVVSIRGTATGRIQARQRLELLAGARVQGTLVSPKLVIEEGAFFQGDCDMGTAPRAAVLALPGPRAAGAEPPRT
jgi:cytoskeletal protein CcmA (bactofilin family)